MKTSSLLIVVSNRRVLKEKSVESEKTTRYFKMQWCAIVVFLFIGCTFANIDNGNHGDLSGLTDKLPSDLTDKIPFNADEIPSPEKAQELFKEKCRKLSNDDKAYESASLAKDKLEICVKSEINTTEIQEEIEKAKPTGDLDIVFGKYCKKSPILIQCVKNFMLTLDPCLEEKEKENKKIVMNITESLVQFLCYKDGDRIAMFIAEGGVECLQEKQEDIQLCANQTIGKNIPKEMPTVENLPLFIIEKEQCDDLSALQVCVVEKLEKCKEPTPANIIDALFKFVKTVTPCGKMDPKGKIASPSKQPGGNSAGFVGSSSIMMLVTLLVSYF